MYEPDKYLYFRTSFSQYRDDESLMEARDFEWGRRLQRWWWDLFLASERDHRTWMHYNSARTFHLEKKRHFYHYYNTIHPFSRFRAFWECLLLCLFMIKMILFGTNTSAIYGDLCIATYYIVAFIEMVVLADLYVNLRTGYVDAESSRVELDSGEILQHYCSTNLFIHAASAIPLQWIMFLRYGSDIDCDLCKTNKFVTTLKCINLINIIRIYQYSDYMLRLRRKHALAATYGLRVLRIFMLALVILFEVRGMADAILLQIMVAENKIYENSRWSIHLRFKASNPTESYQLLCYDFNRMCKSLFLHSFRRYEETTVERLGSILSFTISKSFILWMTIEIFDYVVSSRDLDDYVIMIRQDTINLVKNRMLEPAMLDKVKEFFEYRLTRAALTERSVRWRCLPKIIKDVARLENHERTIRRLPYFNDWPTHMINELVMLLKEMIFLSKDTITGPWLEAEGMVMVQHGELAVYSGGFETGHLIDGDHFGALSLVTDQAERLSTVVAITPCLLMLLHKNLFRNFMRNHTELFFKLKHQLKEKYGDRYEIIPERLPLRDYNKRLSKYHILLFRRLFTNYVVN